jgi:hypothetical protein
MFATTMHAIPSLGTKMIQTYRTFCCFYPPDFALKKQTLVFASQSREVASRLLLVVSRLTLPRHLLFLVTVHCLSFRYSKEPISLIPLYALSKCYVTLSVYIVFLGTSTVRICLHVRRITYVVTQRTLSYCLYEDSKLRREGLEYRKS